MTDYKFIRQIPGGCLTLVEKDRIEYVKKTILDREIRILSKLETVEGITKIREIVPSEFIMDYIPGRDLSFWIRDKIKFTISEIDFILTSLLVILNNIQGVAHSDVKPENIIFNREGYQIDSQRLSSDGNVSKLGGSINYVWPYIGRDKSSDGEYQLKSMMLSDIFAVGVTIYQMIIRNLPYDVLPDKRYDLIHYYPYEYRSNEESYLGHTADQINSIVDQMIRKPKTAQSLLTEWLSDSVNDLGRL